MPSSSLPNLHRIYSIPSPVLSIDAAESGDIVSAELCFEIEARLNQVEDRLLLSPLATSTKSLMDHEHVATTTATATPTPMTTSNHTDNHGADTFYSNIIVNDATTNNNTTNNSTISSVDIGSNITTTATHDNDILFSRPPLLRQQSLREISIYCHDDDDDGGSK